MTEIEENANMSKEVEEDEKEESIYEDSNGKIVMKVFVSEKCLKYDVFFSSI